MEGGEREGDGGWREEEKEREGENRMHVCIYLRYICMCMHSYHSISSVLNNRISRFHKTNIQTLALQQFTHI